MSEVEKTENKESQVLTEQQWVQQEYAKILKYLARNQLTYKQIKQQQSAILPPYIAIWRVALSETDDELWVLSGDLPTDHTHAGSASNARDALRHFALSWQLKAENLNQLGEAGKSILGNEKSQKDYTEILISRAEYMYKMAEADHLWKS